MEQFSLKQARNLKGLSRKAVADALGVHQQTIMNWENGKSFPDALEFLKLCKLYGVSIDSIFLTSR